MAAGGLGHRDLPALEIGQPAQRRVAAHQNRLGGRRRGFLGEIGEMGAGGLGEHRHGVGDVGGQVEVADVECFEQRLAAGELVPAEADVLGRQGLFQGAAGLQQGDQGGGLLVADAQLGFRLDGQGGAQPQGEAETEQGAATEGDERGHDRPRGCASGLREEPERLNFEREMREVRWSGR